MQTRIFDYIVPIIIPGIISTIKMLALSFVFSLILGVILGSILIYTHEDGLKPNKIIYGLLNFILGLIRSFPVIILIVAITPLTKKIVGTSIGSTAALVPITIATTPIIAKNIENVIMEIDKNVILAAKSFGATNFQILYYVLFPEALPSLISAFTLISIICLGTTAVAGAIGAGGLGSVALNYGYQRFDDLVMYSIVIILFIIVGVLQLIGDKAYNYFNKSKNE